MALYVSKHWSVTEWDCLQRSRNEYAWDENGRLCTNDEKTANLFRLLDMLRDWNSNWVINTTNAGYKSGFRTIEVNLAVGGEPNSYHTRGCAADIHISGQDDTDKLYIKLYDSSALFGCFFCFYEISFSV